MVRLVACNGVRVVLVFEWGVGACVGIFATVMHVETSGGGPVGLFTNKQHRDRATLAVSQVYAIE